MIYSVSDLNEIKEIPANDDVECAQVLNETEKFDLRELLGDEFYDDINARPFEYMTLIDVMKPSVAYFFYSKWVMQSQVKLTFSGAVIHTNEYSQPASQGTLKNLSSVYREYAIKEWSRVERYLNENAENYPLWKCKKVHSPANGFISISSIRK